MTFALRHLAGTTRSEPLGMKKIKIGEADFAKIITGGFLYVDKTRHLQPLLETGGFYFLSRPRRFGKSLLTTTLKYIFQGRKDLFEGLWIHDQHDWSVTNPVILISFTTVTYRDSGLREALNLRLDDIGREYGLTLRGDSPQGKLQELIEALSVNGPVVVLLDEYDKPIVDYLDNLPQATANRDILRGFYGCLKDQSLSTKLRMVLLTGVSKFSKVSVFSELNNLSDLTMHPKYTTLLGITQEEVERDFAPYIELLAEQSGSTVPQVLTKMKRWYNGYSWDGLNFVYNPFSLLNLFDTMKFDNYWFASGTPTMLVKALRTQREPVQMLSSMEVAGPFFQVYDLENLDIYAIMFQTGYLTIKSARVQGEQDMYTLGYPNSEVEDAFHYHLLQGFTEKPFSKVGDMVIKIQRAFLQRDMETFIAQLRAMFADIAYQLHPREQADPAKAFAVWEGYFHSLTYLLLRLVGIYIQVEVSQAKGRMDALVQTEGAVYVIEFKLGSAQEALEQIKRSEYAAAHIGQGRPVLLLGIGFDAEEKNVQDWVMEEA